MVKKLQKMAEKKAASAAGLLDSQLAQSVKESAQQIWLAGMGAFAKAQAEGGKVFEALIKEGMSLQKKTQGLAEEKISDVTGKMTAMAGDVQPRPAQHWDKLESIFEQRTAKAMNKLGVPIAQGHRRADQAHRRACRRGRPRLGGQGRAGARRRAAKPAAKAAGQGAARSRVRARPALTARRDAPARRAAAHRPGPGRRRPARRDLRGRRAVRARRGAGRPATSTHSRATSASRPAASSPPGLANGMTPRELCARLHRERRRASARPVPPVAADAPGLGRVPAARWRRCRG